MIAMIVTATAMLVLISILVLMLVMSRSSLFGIIFGDGDTVVSSPYFFFVVVAHFR